MAELLAGVDRAWFATALSNRLRAAGVPVRLDATGRLVAGMTLRPPRSRVELYWLARITLVSSVDDLARFEAVFAAVCGDGLAAGVTSRVSGDLAPPAREPLGAGRLDPGGASRRGGLPWRTRTAATSGGDVDDAHATHGWPVRLPSALVGSTDTPFEMLTPRQVAELGAWLEVAARDWPTRRARRLGRGRRGARIDLRATIAAARRTGWEPARLVTSRPLRRPRRVVLLCDVSQSMQPHAVAYLQLMRALVRAREGEVFAFSTRLTRLTPTLRIRAPAAAMHAASELVTDRFGGTRIAANLAALLASRHRETLRGAVVVIGSDGWDTDPPEQLAAAMARLRRRAHRIVWIDPRAGAPGFTPSVAGLAAALPYCDALLPAATFGQLREVVLNLARHDHSVT